MEREAALADLETARGEWEEAFARVPDAALTYLKPGDDYALGGLQIHVNWILGHYRRVLEAIIASGFGEVGPQDPPGYERDAKAGAKRGMPPSERWKSVEAMKYAHSRISTAVYQLNDSDWSHKAAVIYNAGEEPYPTSPEDIVEWLRDHYREHVAQSADLIEEWRSTK